MRRKLPALAVVLPMALAGCGSPPAHFYALSSTLPVSTAPDCPAPSLSVRRVLLPDVLDRQSFVSAGAGGELDISDRDRWAAPLDRMTQHTLASDLRARLPGRTVLLPGDPTPSGGAEAIEVEVARFMPDRTGLVSLDADWTLLDTHGKPIETRSEHVTARQSDAAQAMSDAVGGLADRIAAAVATGCA